MPSDGNSIDDMFYVRTADGEQVAEAEFEDLERFMLEALRVRKRRRSNHPKTKHIKHTKTHTYNQKNKSRV